MSYRDTILRSWAPGGLRVRDLLAALMHWDALRRSRAALLRLNDAQLRDIGVTRGDARAEARRSLLVDG